jgi:hypothetical protein
VDFALHKTDSLPLVYVGLCFISARNLFLVLPPFYAILLSVVQPFGPFDKVLQGKKDWQSPGKCFRLPQKWHLIGFIQKLHLGVPNKLLNGMQVNKE